MSKARVPRSLAPRQAIHPVGFSPLEIALSKARSARILLEVCAAGGDYLQIPVVLKPGEKVEDIRGWIQSFAFDALDTALEEAEAARQQEHGAAKGRAA